jgi:hypothetical protein
MHLRATWGLLEEVGATLEGARTCLTLAGAADMPHRCRSMEAHVPVRRVARAD